MGENEKNVPSAQVVIDTLNKDLTNAQQSLIDQWLEDKRKLDEQKQSQ